MKKPVALLVGVAIVFGSILFGLQNAHADTVPPTCSRFSDVPSNSEYAPYICWLASTGVTTGTSSTTFSPAASVTRQQMAAFLYRMAGQPAFTPPAKPSFSDVPADSQYFLWIEWLKTTGITTGTSATTFSPTAGVTRQQMAAFLYRMAGQPPFTPPSKPSFSDVPANSDYFVSIEWLKTTGVTTGTSATTFSPTAVVTRQQMAAFLYRMSTTTLGCTPYPARVGCVLMTGSTPTISGTKTVGSTLTVNVGTWTPTGTTTSIQWFRNGVAISGATRTTYVVVAADGGTSITVSVTGTKTGYSPVTKTSAAAAIPGAAFVTAPTPTISGTATVGSTLTVTPGTWTPAATLTYQWFRDGVAIPGATSNKYVLVAADAGHKITVSVTGAAGGYTTTAKASAPTAAVTAAPIDTTKVVPDLAFRACLNSYLGQTAAAPINSAQLKSLTGFLSCRSDGIASLEGAQYLTGLTSLDLGFNQISDVSPLAGLTNLTQLDLVDNQASDVSPLAGLTKLTQLDLGGNQVSDVSLLMRLTNLTDLSLSGDQVSDISPLAGLTKLTQLNLYGNQIGDVSLLARLTNLTWLDLGDTQISDISPLAGLTRLTHLGLSVNQISDVRPLAGLTNLAWLDLGGNQVSDVSPLEGLTKLTTLGLADNQVCDVSPLAHLAAGVVYLGQQTCA